MDWQDEGVVLECRRLGETGIVAALMTRDHGRHLGLVHGGASSKRRAMLQPGNTVTARWRGRLSEHLGTYALEPARMRAGALLNAKALSALSSACALVSLSLPEREPHPKLFEGLTLLFDHLNEDDVWPALYVRWELGLLQELGFGLALDACAVSGETEVTHVSPRTGRGVGPEAAAPYTDKLLTLPAFLRPGAEARAAAPADIKAGLELTGFFLERQVLFPHERTLPEPRVRLMGHFARDCGEPAVD